MKRWEFWFGVAGFVIGVAGLCIGIWQGKIAQNAATDANDFNKKIESKQQEIDQKQQEIEAKQREVDALRAQRSQEQSALCQFADLYRSLLQDLRITASRYKEQPNQENEDALRASANAFVDFIEQWRALQPVLAAMLDGEVDKLSQAIRGKDIPTIVFQTDTIDRKANTNLPVLMEQLRRAFQQRRR